MCALGLFTVAIFQPFFLYFQFLFFIHFSKMNFRMSLKNDHFCKMEHTPPFCKDGHFRLHFAFILLFHFSNSALMPMCNYYDAHTPHNDATTPSLDSLPPMQLHHHPSSPLPCPLPSLHEPQVAANDSNMSPNDGNLSFGL